MAPLSFLKQQDKSSSPPNSPVADSKEKPSRPGGSLLRRKISLARLGSTSVEDAEEQASSASTVGSFAEKQQEITELGRSLFGRQRRGSERSGWFSGSKKPDEAVPDEPLTEVVLVASSTSASRRIAADQNALTEQDRLEQQRGRPDSPVEAATRFPTPLSPPRRKPVPTSPRVHSALQHETVLPAQSLSALGSAMQRPASPASSSDGTGNAAWLARKPSLRSQRENKSPGAISSARLGSPSPIVRRRPSATSRVASSSSAGDEDDDSDAELPTAKLPGYEVEIVCVSKEGEGGEMRWEIAIRPSGGVTAAVAGLQHHHPVLISSNSTITQVPPSASSLNMTLALDQPSGKLVFISLPSSISETPRRSRVQPPIDTPSTPPRTMASPTSPMSSNTRRRGMYLPMRRDADTTPPGSPDLFTPRRSQLDGGLFSRADFVRGESPNPDAMEHLRVD